MARKGETSQRIVLSILMKKESRNQESMDALIKNAAELGLEPTTKGRASLCFQTTPKNFQKLFGVKAKPVAGVAPTDIDYGTSPGFQVDAEIPIPDVLKAHTELISVQPPATRLTEPIAMSELSSANSGSTYDGETKEDQKEDQKEDGKQKVEDEKRKKNDS